MRPFSRVGNVGPFGLVEYFKLEERLGLIVIRGGPSFPQGGQVRVFPLLRTRSGCWPFAHRPIVADRLVAGKPQTTAVLDRTQLGRHDAADEFRVVEPVCPLDNREWFPGSR